MCGGDAQFLQSDLARGAAIRLYSVHLTAPRRYPLASSDAYPHLHQLWRGRICDSAVVYPHVHQPWGVYLRWCIRMCINLGGWSGFNLGGVSGGFFALPSARFLAPQSTLEGSTLEGSARINLGAFPWRILEGFSISNCSCVLILLGGPPRPIGPRLDRVARGSSSA